MNKAKELAKSVLAFGTAVSAILAILTIISPILFLWVKAEIAIYNWIVN